jgi:hypothetical protein
MAHQPDPPDQRLSALRLPGLVAAMLGASMLLAVALRGHDITAGGRDGMTPSPSFPTVSGQCGEGQSPGPDRYSTAFHRTLPTCYPNARQPQYSLARQLTWQFGAGGSIMAVGWLAFMYAGGTRRRVVGALLLLVSALPIFAAGVLVGFSNGCLSSMCGPSPPDPIDDFAGVIVGAAFAIALVAAGSLVATWLLAQGRSGHQHT